MKNMIIKNHMHPLLQILYGTGSTILLDYIIRSEPIHDALRITVENISSKIDPFDVYVHIACEYIVDTVNIIKDYVLLTARLNAATRAKECAF